ncbi:MAG TPA: Tim44-like domain-containing protein [Burkholderiales bacterium]|nr:Tim44-like domain-containing protein [Burkholderiales bacterium]
MKRLLSILISIIGLSFVAVDAEAARRMGGGKNLGMQRSAPAQQQKAAPATPPQQQAAPAAPAQPQPQPSGLQKWLGPLAGLAIGAGLAALFLNNGLGGMLAGILLVGLIVAALVFAARALTRGRSNQHAEPPLQYAGVPGAGPAASELPGGAGSRSVAATTASPAASATLPAEFDAAEFSRHAKLNFVRLQEAHDKKDLSTMRDFLAPGVYREIESDILATTDGPHRTDVVTLEADVIDVAKETGSYVVSVRFSGLIREDAGAPEPFSEIWHLEKPVTGRSGWMVAGIQQS